MSWSPVIPTLRCFDAQAEIEFLTSAFGFTSRLVVPGAEGSVAHAELSYGSGMVMLGSTTDGSDGREPYETAPSAIYVIVNDVAAHFAHAQAAGAKIIQPYQDNEYGGSSYTAVDLEGNRWTFGSYVPSRDSEGAS